MKYAIIENEVFARLNLQNIVETLRPGYQLVFTAETVADAIAGISSNSDLDLVFMDIELDDGNCFEIFDRIMVKTPVIFTTAYDDYAIKAFKVNSIDYLLKPVVEDDMKAAIEKFEEHTAPSGNGIDYQQLSKAMARTRASTRILVTDGDDYSYVNMADIAWFEAANKYIFVKLNDGTSHLTESLSLGEVLPALDPNEFFQLSRSVVTSVNAIVRVSKFFKGRLHVTLKAGTTQRSEIVSAARRQDFLNWLGQR